MSAPCISLEDLRTRKPSALHSLKDALSSPTFGYFELDCTNFTSIFDVDRTYDAARGFFSQSPEIKSQYVHTQYVSESGGYVPILEEYAYVENTAALVESFDVVRDLSVTDLRRIKETLGADAARGLGPMDWPVEVPDMKSAFKAFYASCDAAAEVLMTSVARALDLPHDIFSQYFGETAHCSMRAMHYPSIENTPEVQRSASVEQQNQDRRRSSLRISAKRCETEAVRVVGIAEHTDFEFITILHQTVQGLELKGRDGTWRLAPAHPHSPRFTVIFADALEIFTNGMVRATPHRVLPSSSGKDRYSLVRFNGLNDLAIIEPLAQFVSVDRPRKFAAVTQGEHVSGEVTLASDNLAKMFEAKRYPKSALTAPPKRFAQMLIVSGDKILLGKHTSGEFADRFTGFICEIDEASASSELSPVDVARTSAVRRAGLNPAAFDALNQDLDIREIGRFRFTGWFPGTLVIEHEFLAVFGENSAALAYLFDATATNAADLIPTWFHLDQIPFDDMPEDDEKWYHACLNVGGVTVGGRDAARVVDMLIIGHFHFVDDALDAWSTTAVPFTAPERNEVFRLV